MVKRTDLIRRVGRAARKAGLSWTLARTTGPHDIWDCDGRRVSIPRHREILEHTALAIFRDLEEKLGEGWWR
jgi:hypothetical protein